MSQNHDPAWVIDVSQLSKSFGSLLAVDNITLKVKKGDIFGFLGPNGSGKTTTIRMLCGLLIPDSAKGTCLGLDILTQAAAIKRNVGYMTQHFSLYEDLSVAENLMFVAAVYGMEDPQQSIETILTQFDFQARRNQLVGTLSGGWKQRLALACALLHQPSLLLLDEPTAGVDPRARRDFWNIIYELSQSGVTTLVSTHYMDEAERCSHLAYVSKGRILASGTPDDIIRDCHLFTWRVSGDNVLSLTETIQALPGVDYVIPFGREVHVNGENESLLDVSMQKIKDKGYRCEKMTASLEDVFIKLISEKE